MTATMRQTPSACPACAAAPAAEATADAAGADAQILLSLPTIHCSGCISKIETALDADPGVRSARVNLTLKRASIEAGPEVTAEEMRALVEGLGYEAHELDPGTLNATATDRAGRDLLMRLAVAGFAMMNVMLLSISVWSGAEGRRATCSTGSPPPSPCRRSPFPASPSSATPGRRSASGGSTWTCRSRWRSCWRWSPRCGRPRFRASTPISTRRWR